MWTWVLHSMAPRLEILFEDDDLIAVSKPAGLLSESSQGSEESLLAWVSGYIGKKALAYHRIDRATTGCMLLGKTARFNRQMAQLFAEKRIRKEYWAIVQGEWPKGTNKVDAPLAHAGGGRWQVSEGEAKASLTTFRVLGQNLGFSWVAALPKTGRTHQIRLHCLHVGCPIVGDSVYGEAADSGLMLHARSVRFSHPGTGESLQIVAGVGDNWREWESAFPKALN